MCAYLWEGTEAKLFSRELLCKRSWVGALWILMETSKSLFKWLTLGGRVEEVHVCRKKKLIIPRHMVR